MGTHDMAALHNANQLMLNLLLLAMTERHPEVIEDWIALVYQTVDSTPSLPEETKDVLMRMAVQLAQQLKDAGVHTSQ